MPTWPKAKFDELVGRRFGRLVIKGYDCQPGGTLLDAHCDCGTRRWVKADAVLSGHRKSCDCLKRERREGRSAKTTRPTTSIFKGVHFCTDHKKWRAQVASRGKVHNCGSFNSEKAAARAYDLAAIKIFGESSLTNDMMPHPQ